MKKRHILLSNDDGIHAPGLLALYDRLAQDGHRISVVAPAGERSASSHAISVWRAFQVAREERDGEFFGISLDATPADCAKFALSYYLKNDPPDVVLSGINPGPNFGDAVIYSGTVGAAAEGAFYGFPALAISLGGKWEDEKQFGGAADFAAFWVEHLDEWNIQPRELHNANVPNLPSEEVRGVVVARMGTSKFHDQFHIKQGESWIPEPGLEATEEGDLPPIPKDPGQWANRGKSMAHSTQDGGLRNLDDHVLEEACIALTPLRLDLTLHDAMVPLEEKLRSLRDDVKHEAKDDPTVDLHTEEMTPFVAE